MAAQYETPYCAVELSFTLWVSGWLSACVLQRLWTARSSNYWALLRLLSVCFMSHTSIDVNDFTVHLAEFNHIEHSSRSANVMPGPDCYVSGHWVPFTNHWFCCTTAKGTRQGFGSSRTILERHTTNKGGCYEVSRQPCCVFLLFFLRIRMPGQKGGVRGFGIH